MTVSSWDDYPVHQTSEFIRHPATSDRNFYDRYYFNLHGSSDEVMTIFGLGQYPNLGVTDAFIAVGTAERHRVLRASRPLTDRADLQVGPIRVEIIEPLQKVRVIVEPHDGDIEMDVTWQAAIPAFEEPRQYVRSKGKVVFDTQRFAQLGRWTGSLRAGDDSWDVTPDRWGGSRDRSWGVRPVGEKEPDGIRQDTSVMGGLWNYFPVDFGDHSIVYMLNETTTGERLLEEGVRVWSDPERPVEWLGRPEWEHQTVPGTRMLSGSTITFGDSGIAMRCEPMLANYVAMGTGYGIDPDWRHGQYQGPELVVQYKDWARDEVAGIGQYGVVDHVCRFTYDDPDRGEQEGYGLYEHGFFGPFAPLGLTDRGDVFS
ncbi:MAG: hypothetical protein ACE367_19415 [Acidimicrobiales bacterium]